MNPLLSALTPLYRGLTTLKNAAYDGGFSEALRLPIPVLSVGNLSMGGTGKTPVVIWLSRTIARDYRRPVIVTRSYRTPLREPVPVQLGVPGGAGIFGDEAVELALKAGGLVYTGPVKWRTALKAYQDTRPDFVLVDDGFQHRRLARDFDLVLVDATDERTQLLPAGRLREDFGSLRRADAVMITKTNLARPEFLAKLRESIRAAVGASGLVIEAEFHLRDPEKIAAAGFGRPVALISAVGRNEELRKQVEGLLQRPLDLVIHERDHHAWSEADTERLRVWWRQHPDGLALTTEKDLTKLRERLRDEKRLVALGLQVAVAAEDEARLFARIREKLKGVTREDSSVDIEAGPWP